MRTPPIAALVLAIILAGCAGLPRAAGEVVPPPPAAETPSPSAAVTPISPESLLGVRPADTPPDFTLPLLGGGEARLADYLGQPILINFWATWCPPCRVEMPAMQQAYERYRSDGFTILAVNFQEDEDAVRRFVEELGITFPVLLDRRGEVTTKYRVLGLPTSIFVDRSGKVYKVRVGAMTEEFLEATVKELVRP